MNECHDNSSCTDPVPNTMILDGLPQVKVSKDEITDMNLGVQEVHSSEKTGYLSGTDLVSQNASIESVSLQIIADIIDQIVSNDENEHMGSIDLIPQKTTLHENKNGPCQVDFDSPDSISQTKLVFKEPNCIQQVLTSNEKTEYLRSANSMPKHTIALDDSTYVLSKKLKVFCGNVAADSDQCVKNAFNEETDYFSDTNFVSHSSVKLDHCLDRLDSVPQKSAMTDDFNNVACQKNFRDADTVPQKTLTTKDNDYNPPQKMLIPNEVENSYVTDSVPSNIVAVGNLNYSTSPKKSVLGTSETPDSDQYPSTSTADSSNFNSSGSVSQNPVKLEYESPHAVADYVDKLNSNDEIILLDVTKSKVQKSIISEDPNQVHHQADIDQVDSGSKKTLTPKDPDYVPPQQVFENEKADIVDPRWETVKELTSNEERYNQVKACWGSSTVPDPDKNLTYHSFRRKKIIRSGELRPRVKQHKRKASTTLNNETKRPCTYLVDKEIREIIKRKEEKSREIQNEMNQVIHELRERQYQQEICYGNNMAFNYRGGGNSNYASAYQSTVLSKMRHEHERQLTYIKNKYREKTLECTSRYEPKLNELENIRQEVLQFYTFYKGMGINIEKDPTVLSDFQLKVLNDTENFYKQMKNFYK